MAEPDTEFHSSHWHEPPDEEMPNLPASAATYIQPSEHYAYNVGGIVYDHLIQDRKEFRVLRIRGTSSKPLSQQNGITRPSLIPTARELSEDEELEATLWVGMMPGTAESYSVKSLSDQRKRAKEEGSSGKKAGGQGTKRLKGSSIADARDFAILPFDPTALRIVVSMRKESMAKFYALVNPEMDLCYGFNVSMEHVFYFPEFRDDSLTATEERRGAWNRKILNHIRAVSKDGATKFARRWILEQLAEVLKAADSDLSHCPPITNAALHKLVSIKKDFTIHDAEKVIRECINLWPELRELKLEAEGILALSKGLRDSQVILEYRLIRGVIVEWHRRVGEAGALDPQGLSELAIQTRKHVSLQFGEIPSSSTSLERDSLAAWVECHTQHIKALSEYNKLYVSALKNSQDDQVVAESLPAIWQTYANRPDVDSTRLMAGQAQRYNVSQLAGRDEGVGAKLDDYVKFLERFQQSVVLEEHEGDEES
ncbi:MAG: hypothetical protein M1839_001950 [Geoglossum umbratile]|nr:MAG: hypothetical protein M1839_001950 [Geoglossum umbratile]